MSRPIASVKNSLLLVLLGLLLVFFKGPDLLYGSLSLLAVTLYYFLTDYRFSPDQIARRGYLGTHLLLYMLLCSSVIWTTSGTEESHYWIIYLLPIFTGASVLSLNHTVLLCSLSSAVYLGLIPMEAYQNPADLQEDLPEFIISCISLFIVGILVQSQAEQSRKQLRQEKELNDQLSMNQEALRRSMKKLNETEENLRRQDRLAALGEMSAGLAHEIRNPLGIISSSAQLLDQGKNSADAALVSIIQEESDRLNTLVSRFLDFGRSMPLHRQPCQLNLLLEQIVDHVHSLAERKNLRIDAVLPCTPIEVQVDPELLHQSILNLLLNAIDACHTDGTITVSLTQNNNQVQIAVKDDGSGIAPEHLSQIFNPFFTTRERGSGLGLANTHKAISLHGGTIDVQSRCGLGSTFTIVLPLKENNHAPHSHC